MKYRFRPPNTPRPADGNDPQTGGSDQTDDDGSTGCCCLVIVLGVVILIGFVVFGWLWFPGGAFFRSDAPQQQSNLPLTYDIVGFVSAIDPATIAVDLNGDEVTVKLIGVQSAGVGDRFDAQVKDRMQEALDGASLTIERAIIEEDAGGNLLRYVHIDSEITLKLTIERAIIEEDAGGNLLQYVHTNSDITLNELLVLNGLARVGDVAPGNGFYLNRMRGAEELARVEGLGAWGLPQ